MGLGRGRRPFRRNVFALVSVLGLAACAQAQPYVQQQQAGFQPMIPIDLEVNPGLFLSQPDVNMSERFQSDMLQAKLFEGVELGAGPCPAMLRAYVGSECHAGVGTLANALVTGGTLGIVPLVQTCDFKIRARFFFGTHLVADRLYSETYTKKSSYVMGEIEEEKRGIDAVFKKMADDFQKKPPLPAVNTGKQEQPRPHSGLTL